MRAAARGWGQLAELFVDAARGVASMAGLVRPTVESSVTGPIGPHRRWDWAHTTLADVKRVRSVLGGTVNDVVLTVLTRGFRDLIVARDESPAGRVVRTLVPVSVRLADERGAYNNRASAMFPRRPLGVTDPAARPARAPAPAAPAKDGDPGPDAMAQSAGAPAANESAGD